MGNVNNTDYIDHLKVRDELLYANFIFEKGGFTKINVTSKPIETTANEIIGMISERFGTHSDRVNDSINY
jgi:regulator of PEP synthase PpsR (kinase-PPPase family)